MTEMLMHGQATEEQVGQLRVFSSHANFRRQRSEASSEERCRAKMDYQWVPTRIIKAQQGF